MRTLLVVLVLALSPGTARAESWGSTLGALLKDASRIEILDVTSITGDAINGKLSTPIRSRHKIGDPVRIALGPWMPSLPISKGDRLLIICDDLCPRAAGVERNGIFALVAQQPGNAGAVFPDFVERTSLPLLATNSPTPPLCLRGSFELVDEPTRGTFQVSLSAADGRGRGTLESSPVESSRAFLDDLSLRTPSGGLLFHRDGALSRDPTGCYSATFALSGPLPRSRAGLARALAGKLSPSPLARGTLSPGRSFELLLDADGQLVVSGTLAEGTRVGSQSFATRELSFFRLKPGISRDTILLVDLGTTGTSLTLAKHLRTVRAPSARLSTRRDTATDPKHDTPLGTVSLTYLPER